jgi:serine/threonine protein kinase/pimeloyl-ACP methyl ester carboxylesterase/tetratricopeptide (TPR) repeat protein
MEQQIHFCTTTDGARIAYAEVGQGPPLLKAANWLSHLEFDWRSPIWRHLLAEFARDHTFIRYDERGSGLSDWNLPDLSFDTWVQDLESVVAAAGVDRFPLLGISQGGAVAIAYAARHPERVSHLILYGAYARGWAKRESPEEIEQRQAALTLVRLGWGKDNPAFRQMWTTLYAPDATQEQAQSFNDLQRISTSPENAVRLLNEMGNIDVFDLLPQIKVPTLVLHCRDEAGVPFEEGRKLAGSIPGARFVPLDGRNHLLLEGDPSWGAFVKEVRGFLGTEVTSALTEVSDAVEPAKPNLKRTDLPERYSIVSFLGVGGMGEVYLAEDKKLGRKVALKTLPAEFTDDKERLRRFQHEARAASALNHPNILTIHEVGAESGAHFIAAEYIDGETLRATIRRGRMKIDDALDMAQQTAFALTAAHGAGIVHRDIKPENIMVRHDGIVKVLDFGLAKLLEGHQRNVIDPEADTRALVLTDPGKVLGTPQYMSPEQARGQELDPRSDIWSLGVVLYEMVAGRAPFSGETKSHTVVAILESEPPPLATFAPDTPAELQRIVRKALAKDRDSRYQTARDLMIDLKSLRRDLDLQSEIERSTVPSAEGFSGSATISELLPPPASSTESIGETTQPRGIHTQSSGNSFGRAISRHKNAFTVAVILLLFMVAGGGYWFFGRHTVGATPIGSIAVLPFVNASGNTDVEYLTEGMTESLITSLSQLPRLSVKARSSVFRYQGKDVSPQQVGKELNVQAIVNGRVMQRGNELTLHIELVDASSETAVWSADYNRSMTDLVSLQSEIARDVSNKLRKLSGEDEQKLEKNYTRNAEAYQLYLKGRFYWNKRTEESYQKAIDYFRQAVEKDPNYALAYTGIADCYSFLSSQGIRPPQDVFPLAKDAATKALQIDPGLSEAHTSLAYVKLYYDWAWAEAEQEYKRAIELNPNYATPHHGYAYLLISSGRTEEAITEIKKAEAIDPLSVLFQTDHGEYYYFTRRPDEAIAQLQKAIDMDSSFVRAHFLMGRALIQKGRCDQGIDEGIKAEQMGPVGEQLGWLAQEYAACGRKAEALKVMNQLLEISKNHYVSPHWFAATQAGLGNKEEAFKWLDQAIDRRFGPMIYLKVNPIWDPLRSDPRFAERLRRVGLQ